MGLHLVDPTAIVAYPVQVPESSESVAQAEIVESIIDRLQGEFIALRNVLTEQENLERTVRTLVNNDPNYIANIAEALDRSE